MIKAAQSICFLSHQTFNQIGQIAEAITY